MKKQAQAGERTDHLSRLERLALDAALGRVTGDRTPEEAKLQEQMAREIRAAKRRGAMIYIPSDGM